MSDAREQVLTREEIDAILASVASSSQDDARTRRVAGPCEPRAFSWTPVARALRDFGDECGRRLSSVYQRSIALTLLDLRSLPADDFAAGMLPTDAPVLLHFAPGGSGALLIGRTLFYGWLTLDFGGEIDASPLHVPNRRYSRIELRHLQAATKELAQLLTASLAPVQEARIEVGANLEPELAGAAIAPRLLVASFDATGFGEVARLRIALPDGLFGREPDSRAVSLGSAVVAERIREAPVELRAEIGSAELKLGRLRELRCGDVVSLRPSSPGGLLVRIGGEAKFRATRGALGARLALRISERL
jgi:flagellar motor switch protein FliM